MAVIKGTKFTKARPRISRNRTGIPNLSFNHRCPFKPWTVVQMIGGKLRKQVRFSTWQEAIDFRDAVRAAAGLDPITDDDFDVLNAFIREVGADD